MARPSNKSLQGLGIEINYREPVGGAISIENTSVRYLECYNSIFVAFNTRTMQTKHNPELDAELE